MDSTIQIYCRVRPIKKNKKLIYDKGKYWTSQDEQGSRIGFHVPKDQLQGLINHSKENFEFKFHHLFDVDSNQEEVFDVVAKPVVQSALQGYNGTIFAYGQTGSGKTFTITGGAERYTDRGLIPRTLQHIFKQIENDTLTQYSVHISYLEIYNEVGYDLLDSSRDAKKLEDLPKVTLQEDSNEYIHLRNLSIVQANSEEEALNLLFVGDTNRMIAETPSNPASSRSHCIFIISLTARQNGSDVIRRSKLHLVDLAGSERVARTGLDGNLLKEAKHINLSLHYLEQVIIALHEAEKGRRAHVPYRNSMMTSVLRDSLGGNCKTTMIATVAVEDLLIDESISTCRFAQRVALISNHATLNEEMDPQLLIQRLKQEIARLKAELEIAQGGGDAFPDGLPDYEKSRIKQAVDGYVQDTSIDSELLFSDFKKIQYAFQIMKDMILGKSGTTSGEVGISKEVTQGLSPIQIEQMEKMKRLAEHRDNEINILVGMIAQLKEQLKARGGNPDSIKRPTEPFPQRHHSEPTLSERKAIATVPIPSTNLKSTKQQLSTEKARAFELFKQSYPASEWIDSQKQILKFKYSEAKKLGETAQSLRNQMKHIKEQLTDPDADSDLRAQLPEMVQQYKQSYQTLKELKLEIEHLQHLLEQGRVRMTRDFEAWYVQVYQETEQPYDTESEPVSRQDSLRLVFKPQSPPQTIGSLLTKADSPQTIGSLLTKADSDYTARPRSQTPLTTSPRVLSRQSESLSNSTPSIATTLYSPKPTPIDVKSFDRVSSRQSNHSEGRPTSSQSRNVRQDVQAFYQARQEIMNRTRPSLQ